MSTVRYVQEYGNMLAVIFDDGSRVLAYPTPNSGLYIVSGVGSSAPWVWPVHFKPDGITKWNLGDGYGPRISPITGLPSFHYGQDINGGGISGTDILSPAVGIVRGVGTDPTASYGYNVRIQHGDGSGTLCAHMLNSPPVTVGQAVSAGDIIGAVGNTGDSTGTHLHFNTQSTYSSSVNANTVDPLAFMSSRGAPW